MLGWRARRVPDKKRTRIPVQSWPALFEAAESPHERLVLATGLYLFLRVSEMAALRVRHVDLQNGLLEVWRQKTQESDTMPIAAELSPHLRDHLRWMTERGFRDPDHFLLPRFTKSYQQVNGRFAPGLSGLDPTKPATHLHRFAQRPTERAGLPLLEGEGAHALRRSGARAYFDALVADGYDGALRRVQTMLGHKNSLMTEVYLGLDLDRQTRNSDLAGKPMFPGLAGNVSQLRRADGLPS
jgi:integrase